MDGSLLPLVNTAKETTRFLILAELYAELERISKALADPHQDEDTYSNLDIRFESFQKTINIIETMSLGD